VNERAGRTKQSTEKCVVLNRSDLMREKPVTPRFQNLGVTISSGDLCGRWVLSFFVGEQCWNRKT
jgi:hypothetical protein